MVSTGTAASLTKNFLIEGARIMGAIAGLAGILWIMGQSAATDFVVDVVDGMKLASESELVQLGTRAEKLEQTDEGLKTAIGAIQRDQAVQKKDTSDIEELLKTQSGDIKTLIKEVGKLTP